MSFSLMQHSHEFLRIEHLKAKVWRVITGNGDYHKQNKLELIWKVHSWKLV